MLVRGQDWRWLALLRGMGRNALRLSAARPCILISFGMGS